MEHSLGVARGLPRRQSGFKEILKTAGKKGSEMQGGEKGERYTTECRGLEKS